MLQHLFLLPFVPASFSPTVGAAYQADILGAASGAEVVDVEHLKIVPFDTCEMTFGQNVCELVSGVSVTTLDLGVTVEQPI